MAAITPRLDYGTAVGQSRVDNEYPVVFRGLASSPGANQTVWNGGTIYTGFPASADFFELVSSSSNDVGTVASSGTISTTSKSVVDTSADFVADGVVQSDLVVNDTNGVFGYVWSVNQKELELVTLHNTRKDRARFYAGDSYRVVQSAGTGTGCIWLRNMLDDEWYSRPDAFVVTNGQTPVATPFQGTRCTRGRSIKTGSGNNNAGDITLYQQSTPANEFFVMPAGNCATQVFAVVVGRGETGLFKRFRMTLGRANGAAGSTLISARSRPLFGDFADDPEFELTTSSSIEFTSVTGEDLVGPLDFRVDIITVSANNLTVEGAGEILIRPSEV